MKLLHCVMFLLGLSWNYSQASPTSQENVPTTNDGVPIIEGSYFNSPNFTGGKPSSPFIPRPQDTASIHFPELNRFQNGFHETSKKRRVIKRRSSRKLIKVKAADGSIISEIPHFSEEVTFRRANNADEGNTPKRGDIQVRSLDSDGASGKESEGLRLYTKLIEEGPRRRRNNLRSLESRRRRFNCSQVATEGKEFLTKPQCSPRRNCRRCASGVEANQLETRTNSGGEEMIYPVIQTIGQGDDQVNARVLSSSDANQQINLQQSSSFNSNGGRQEISYTTGAKSRKGYYRRTVFKNFTTSEHPSTFAAWLN